MIKAVVIIIACLFGIRFYLKSKFIHLMVVLCLVAAIIVIILEVFVYRLSKGGKDLRFRYMNNTAAMWLVYMAFSFMV
jgi:uncharacterized membrane protein YjjP (DUF1212 family)